MALTKKQIDLVHRFLCEVQRCEEFVRNRGHLDSVGIEDFCRDCKLAELFEATRPCLKPYAMPRVFAVPVNSNNLVPFLAWSAFEALCLYLQPPARLLFITNALGCHEYRLIKELAQNELCELQRPNIKPSKTCRPKQQPPINLTDVVGAGYAIHRRRDKITQTTVANELGCSQGTVSKMFDRGGPTWSEFINVFHEGHASGLILRNQDGRTRTQTVDGFADIGGNRIDRLHDSGRWTATHEIDA